MEGCGQWEKLGIFQHCCWVRWCVGLRALGDVASGESQVSERHEEEVLGDAVIEKRVFPEMRRLGGREGGKKEGRKGGPTDRRKDRQTEGRKELCFNQVSRKKAI